MLAIIIAISPLSACEDSPYQLTYADLAARPPANRIEVPVSTGDTKVRVSATALPPGDHYGSIEITSGTSSKQVIHIPVHATVYRSSHPPDSVLLSPPTPSQALSPERAPAPLRQVTVEEVRWVKPPPPVAEAGVDYPVSFYGWLKYDSGSYFRPSVVASDKEDLSGVASIDFEEDTPSWEGPIEGTLRFESCKAQTVYVYLRWFTKNEDGRGNVVKVQVSPPSAPRPLLDSKTVRASAVEGPNPGRLATLRVRSLCNLPLYWKVLTDAAWLDVSPSQGIADEAVNLSLKDAVIRAGSYRTTLTVAAIDSPYTTDASVYVFVSPVRLQWDPILPSTAEAGEEILAAFRGLPGFVPSSSQVTVEGADENSTGYVMASGSAVPRPDGSWIAPIRIGSCSGGRVRVRARAYSPSFGTGEAPPAYIDVGPARGAILDVSPPQVFIYAAERQPPSPHEIKISLYCGPGSGTATLTASQPWILLEDISSEVQYSE